jgi:hypothetical protein
MNNIEEFDLVVIGAGAAGIIFTLEYTYLNPNSKIALLEYGFEKTDNSKNGLDDTIKIQNTVNHHEPYECTNKGLGGSTATWGGRCVMFDEIDFLDRPILKNGCTWDKDLYEELQQFIQKSADYFECGKAEFNINDIEGINKKRIVKAFVEGDVTDSVVERWSMPTRFGTRYRQELTSNPNIRLIEGIEVLRLVSENDLVKIIEIKDRISGSINRLNAKKIVLSAGTQETTRLLLKNSSLFKNPSKTLGKYYQSHISGKIASVKFYDKPHETDFGFQKDGDVYIRRRFQFSKDFLLKNNHINTAIWLDNPLYYDPKHKSGAMSFMYLMMLLPVIGRKLAPPAIAHSITKGKKNKVLSHIMNILRDFPKSFWIPAMIFINRYLLKRKLPGVFLYSPNNTYALHFHAEQLPVEQNKMYIASDGVNLCIDYNLVDDEINSIISLHEKLDSWLREHNCGELVYWFPKENLAAEIRQMSKDGIHQSGTTRIGESIEDGVVDRNLKVFGVDNLYICSSSVFPTSGQANPTFLIGVFAVRLAHHISKL